MSEVSSSLDYLSISRQCISRMGANRQIELLLVSRWYDTWQEHCKGAVAIAAAQYFEYHVHSGLQLGHGMLVVVHGIDRLAVNFRDDIATAKAEVIGKARGVDIGDQHPALAFHADARGALRR